MDKIIRTITSDGAVMAAALDASDICFTAQRLHKTSPSATAALGRLLTGASVMGAMLKQASATLTLRVNGGGPYWDVSDDAGIVYAQNGPYVIAIMSAQL